MGLTDGSIPSPFPNSGGCYVVWSFFYVARGVHKYDPAANRGFDRATEFCAPLRGQSQKSGRPTLPSATSTTPDKGTDFSEPTRCSADVPDQRPVRSASWSRWVASIFRA